MNITLSQGLVEVKKQVLLLVDGAWKTVRCSLNRSNSMKGETGQWPEKIELIQIRPLRILERQEGAVAFPPYVGWRRSQCHWNFKRQSNASGHQAHVSAMIIEFWFSVIPLFLSELWWIITVHGYWVSNSYQELNIHDLKLQNKLSQVSSS